MSNRALSAFLLLVSGLTVTGQVTVPVNDAEESARKRADLVEHIFYDVDWVLDAGVFYAWVDSRIQVNGSEGNVGSYIDLENDMDLSEAELLFNAALGYHGWDRWSLEFEWFELNRDSNGVLSEEIYWGNTILPVGAEYDFYFDVEVYRVLVGYEVWSSPHSVIGVGFGVHGSGMETGIDATLDIGAGGSLNFKGTASTGALLPLPNFGIWASRAYSDKLLAGVRMDGFALDIDDYRGSLVSMEGFMRYQATPKISLGIGYSYFRLSATMRRDQWNGKAKFGYHGPKAFLFYAW